MYALLQFHLNGFIIVHAQLPCKYAYDSGYYYFPLINSFLNKMSYLKTLFQSEKRLWFMGLTIFHTYCSIPNNIGTETNIFIEYHTSR